MLNPAWFPSGDRLVFATTGATGDAVARQIISSGTISTIRADGGDEVPTIARDRLPVVSRDGRHVIYVVDRSGDVDLWYSRLTPTDDRTGLRFVMVRPGAGTARPTPILIQNWFDEFADTRR